MLLNNKRKIKDFNQIILGSTRFYYFIKKLWYKPFQNIKLIDIFKRNLKLNTKILSTMQQFKERIQNLTDLAEAFGVLKHMDCFTFSSFKLTYNPFLSTKQFHQYVGNISQLWQKLLFKVSKDRIFIQRLFQPLKKQDYMVQKLLNIYMKKKDFTGQYGISFARVDYYRDLLGQVKLTQYNIMSVGMQSNMQQFQQAKRIQDYQDRHLYPQSATIQCFAQATKQIYQKKKLQGIFLFAISDIQRNFLDQKRFEIELMKRNIKTKRANFSQMMQKISIDKEGNLFYDKQLVSVVYYRIGYRLDHFIFDGNDQKCWKMKQDIELSNAVCIPPVVMELVNQKRTQAELTKPQILRKYLTQQQAVQIEKTLVKEWQFDTMSEQIYTNLVRQISQNPQSYILKPNMQGGGNNFYGIKAYQKLRSMDKNQRRAFILMEKIISPAENYIVVGDQKFNEFKCLLQISRYGALNWIDGQLNRNDVAGFLIRAKPQHENEGGIMAGIGSIVPWKFTE